MANPTMSAEERAAIPACFACGSKAIDASGYGHHDWDHPADPRCPVFSCTWTQIEGVNKVIRQAEQAARADERRKALEEARQPSEAANIIERAAKVLAEAEARGDDTKAALAHRLAEARAREGRYKDFHVEVMGALTDAGICTPIEGYLKPTSPRVGSDIKRLASMYQRELAEARAEIERKNEALRRIADANVLDMNTLHPDGIQQEAREALANQPSEPGEAA